MKEVIVGAALYVAKASPTKIQIHKLFLHYLASAFYLNPFKSL